MLLFYLDKSSFNNTYNLADIQMAFWCEIVSTFADENMLTNLGVDKDLCSRFPQLDETYNPLDAIIDDNIEQPKNTLLQLMEKAQFKTIPSIGQSLNSFGLKYVYVACITYKDYNNALLDQMVEKNLQILNEEIMPVAMCLESKIDYLSKALLNCESSGQELTIIDPYIFPPHHDDDYVKLFCGICKKCGAAKVRVFTSSPNEGNKFSRAVLNEIKEDITVPMDIYSVPNLHDRFWIIKSKNSGLICGTSLNGLGKDSLSTLNPMNEKDIKGVLEFCNSNSQKIT